jgi:hypothetical protein
VYFDPRGGMVVPNDGTGPNAPTAVFGLHWDDIAPPRLRRVLWVATFNFHLAVARVTFSALQATKTLDTLKQRLFDLEAAAAFGLDLLPWVWVPTPGSFSVAAAQWVHHVLPCELVPGVGTWAEPGANPDAAAAFGANLSEAVAGPGAAAATAKNRDAVWVGVMCARPLPRTVLGVLTLDEASTGCLPGLPLAFVPGLAGVPTGGAPAYAAALGAVKAEIAKEVASAVKTRTREALQLGATEGLQQENPDGPEFTVRAQQLITAAAFLEARFQAVTKVTAQTAATVQLLCELLAWVRLSPASPAAKARFQCIQWWHAAVRQLAAAPGTDAVSAASAVVEPDSDPDPTLTAHPTHWTSVHVPAGVPWDVTTETAADDDDKPLDKHHAEQVLHATLGATWKACPATALCGSTRGSWTQVANAALAELRRSATPRDLLHPWCELAIRWASAHTSDLATNTDPEYCNRGWFMLRAVEPLANVSFSDTVPVLFTPLGHLATDATFQTLLGFAASMDNTWIAVLCVALGSTPSVQCVILFREAYSGPERKGATLQFRSLSGIVCVLNPPSFTGDRVEVRMSADMPADAHLEWVSKGLKAPEVYPTVIILGQAVPVFNGAVAIANGCVWKQAEDTQLATSAPMPPLVFPAGAGAGAGAGARATGPSPTVLFSEPELTPAIMKSLTGYWLPAADPDVAVGDPLLQAIVAGTTISADEAGTAPKPRFTVWSTATINAALQKAQTAARQQEGDVAPGPDPALAMVACPNSALTNQVHRALETSAVPTMNNLVVRSAAEADTPNAVHVPVMGRDAVLRVGVALPPDSVPNLNVGVANNGAALCVVSHVGTGQQFEVAPLEKVAPLALDGKVHTSHRAVMALTPRVDVDADADADADAGADTSTGTRKRPKELDAGKVSRSRVHTKDSGIRVQPSKKRPAKEVVTPVGKTMRAKKAAGADDDDDEAVAFDAAVETDGHTDTPVFVVTLKAPQLVERVQGLLTNTLLVDKAEACVGWCTGSWSLGQAPVAVVPGPPLSLEGSAVAGLSPVVAQACCLGAVGAWALTCPSQRVNPGVLGVVPMVGIALAAGAWMTVLDMLVWVNDHQGKDSAAHALQQATQAHLAWLLGANVAADGSHWTSGDPLPGWVVQLLHTARALRTTMRMSARARLDVASINNAEAKPGVDAGAFAGASKSSAKEAVFSSPELAKNVAAAKKCQSTEVLEFLRRAWMPTRGEPRVPESAWGGLTADVFSPGNFVVAEGSAGAVALAVLRTMHTGRVTPIDTTAAKTAIANLEAFQRAAGVFVATMARVAMDGLWLLTRGVVVAGLVTPLVRAPESAPVDGPASAAGPSIGDEPSGGLAPPRFQNHLLPAVPNLTGLRLVTDKAYPADAVPAVLSLKRAPLAQAVGAVGDVHVPPTLFPVLAGVRAHVAKSTNEEPTAQLVHALGQLHDLDTNTTVPTMVRVLVSAAETLKPFTS